MSGLVKRGVLTAVTALLVAWWLVGVPPAALGQGLSDHVAALVQGLEQAAGGPIEVTRSQVTGLVTFASTTSPIPLPMAVTAPAEARARAFMSAYGPAFGIADIAGLAHVRSLGLDDVGMEHVRFRQLHAGVPVTGGELSVHLRGAEVIAVNARTLAFVEKLDTTPAIDAAEALARAGALIAKQFGITDAVLSSPRLEVFNRGMLEDSAAETRLAWFIEATRLDLRQFIWIDAHTGIRLLEFSQLADALNRSIYDGNGLSTLPGTLVRSEGQGPTADLDVNAAYDFAGQTYNYYLGQHGRDSYNGAGAPLVSTVHYCPTNDGCNYGNAFWNGSQMVYGNGFSRADDVVAHELTHAVTEFSAGLFYYMQSGALNESYSDIFGEAVDLTNGAGTDTAGVRWQIAEDLPGVGAIRNMMNPGAFGDPGRIGDPLFVCDTPGTDNGGVHSNSGVPNHAFALMVDGGTFNGFTVAGIGLTKAAKVQYRALTVYLLSASNFRDNYDAVKRACVDLVGVAGITAANCTEVGKALDAVQMASPWPCSPPQPAVPAFCPAGQLPTNLFFDNLENTASGHWAISTLSGNNHWSYPAPPDFVFATSGTRNFWADDRPDAGDSVIAMTSSVPIPAGLARLQFNHSYGFEGATSNFDGGVIESSTNAGGSWTDAGALIKAGAAYGGILSSGFGNPLGGRSAFVKDSFGYTASQLNLAGLAGQNVRFRFRMGTDSSIADVGWFIDDVRIYRCGSLRDFNGEGKADLLWRHSSGTLAVWLLNGLTILGSGVPGSLPPEWAVAGVGDFNGDGKADVLWRNTSTGAVLVWLLNGLSLLGAGSLGTVGNDWVIAGVGDVNGDGRADIVWRHSSGTVALWFLDGTTVTVTSILSTVGTDWSIARVADFNGDGKADLLWRHTSGSLSVWLLNGPTVVSTSILPNPGAWNIEEVGDFNGDGKADILWRNAAGTLAIWLLDGGTMIGSGVVGTVGNDWSVDGVADFNGDGEADILWRQNTGAVALWFFNGLSIIGSGTLGSISPTWQIQ